MHDTENPTTPRAEERAVAREAFTLIVSGPNGEELARIDGAEIPERLDTDATE